MLKPSWAMMNSPASATGTNDIACSTIAAATAASSEAPKNRVTPNL